MLQGNLKKIIVRSRVLGKQNISSLLRLHNWSEPTRLRILADSSTSEGAYVLRGNRRPGEVRAYGNMFSSHLRSCDSGKNCDYICKHAVAVTVLPSSHERRVP